MIVVRIELWPRGSREAARVLAEIEIARESDLLNGQAVYAVRQKAGESVVLTEVRHMRSAGWRPLVGRAMAKLWGLV